MSASLRIKGNRSAVGAAIGIAALLAAGAWSASAHALGLANPQAAPVSDTQAGANAAFHVHLDVTEPEDQLRDLIVELPPGLGGNPQAVEKCAVADFEAGSCSSASVVGETNAGVNLFALGLLDLPVPGGVNGTVYNLVPNPGEPARLGIELAAVPVSIPVLGEALLPPIRTQVEAALRPDDLGLNTILTDLDRQATLVSLPGLGDLVTADVRITSLDLTLSEAFMFNPTSCAEATTRFLATSWAGNPGEPLTAEASFTPTGCESLAFAPNASLTVDGGPDVTTGHPTVSTSVTQGPGEANAERVVLTLPLGLGPDLDVLLSQACTQAAFAAGTCPATTRVGSAVAQTPLLDAPLGGSVYRVEALGGFPNIGIHLSGALDIKLQAVAGFVTEGPGLNRIQSILEGLPDLPLSRFDLTFDGGPGGLFTARSTVCAEAARLDGSFDSHGGQSVTRSVKPEVIGCAPQGGGGRDPSGFRCRGQRATIVGTPGNDVIRGTPGRDVIVGLGGNDVIHGLGGNDLICGGRGHDRIFGGPGNDRIFGGPGRDRLFGGRGNDRIFGGRGNDRLFGGRGNDRLFGGRGHDRLFGGPGRDRLFGGPGRDRLVGGPGRDLLRGGKGRDRVRQ